jgi:hypothetical protein
VKLEEYEQILKEEKKAEEPKKPSINLFDKVPYARHLQNYCALEESLEYGARELSEIYDPRDFDGFERELIGEACVGFINKIAYGTPLTENQIAMVESHLYQFVATYIYRWYPRMRAPNVKCMYESSDAFRGFSLTVLINDVYVCTIGIKGL